MQDPTSAIASGTLTGSNLVVWLALSQAVLFLTGISTLFFNYMRDGRTRRWLEADRVTLAAENETTRKALASENEAAAKAMQAATAQAAKAIADKQAASAQELATKQAESAKALADHTTKQTADLRTLANERADKLQADLVRIAAEVAETKLAASDAYKEANHVNLKISDLNQRLLDAEKLRSDGPSPA